MKQTKARIEDALHATRAAAEEGIVAGGRRSLLRVFAPRPFRSCTIPWWARKRSVAAIILRSLEEPIRHIASNSGHDGGVIAD